MSEEDMPGIVIPGDDVNINLGESTTTAGPGIYKNPRNQEIIPTTAGYLNVRQNKANTQNLIYIDSNSKRYIPQVNDLVIGIITGVLGESYKVQLQDHSTNLLLSMTAFPNATKKNRPNLRVGQAVYARVSQADPNIDAEVECFDPTTGKDGGFGLLDESGYIFDVNLNFARDLLFNQNSPFLEKLATRCKFEIAIGMNGKIWLKCGDGVKAREADSSSTQENTNGNTDKSALIKNLKTTLAAAKYLTRCQSISVDQVDEELRAAFKSI
ncbi:Piso0_004793 [Millerozyma farinosa CBS 7064]|uniref:Piso0_004793 protein n=1 Tax=Pichia sorbitophila (strain ATCC MYA-4447 / BCRC 22081 / CBS 7064 / NBRC 10061 / NRRL Y-12695) TaxID=559304 RepID=G8Y3E3_PICSO|nr:Piso0_004793 [Millerozyma farinosa CBS 7064]